MSMSESQTGVGGAGSSSNAIHRKDGRRNVRAKLIAAT